MVADLEARNAAKYNEDKLAWEMETGIKRLRVGPNYPRRKPQFTHNKTIGAYVLDEGKKGINWWRH
jgi:hypothetical protein